ncbi:MULTISPECIES: hypothetical protein [unclassified Cupriavidus]|nr:MULTISPECIES: hypothetical protein [unclassified Cupriavidus]MCA3185907.1 hypothetical protein [Cupriavidus sp.]MCA3189086.1 hypothetical protein [Cupriavidus sp.]MCA3198805.1 hypothetical protein [Cupriavidus sp.]MCA3201551.1 hypothetical protein [Cupriavidus sp.]MCA3207172.1 hypothetical protein [Cupriavidus sp.]
MISALAYMLVATGASCMVAYLASGGDAYANVIAVVALTGTLLRSL